MTVDAPWPGSEQENAAVAALARVLRGLADTLYTVEEARYIEPSGGYIPAGTPRQS